MQNLQLDTKRIGAGALALLLWLASTIVGLVDIYLLRQTYIRLAFRGGASAADGVFGADVVVVILSLVWIVFVIGTGEYHRQHAGQPRAWRVFAWTGLVQLAILAVYLLS